MILPNTTYSSLLGGVFGLESQSPRGFAPLRGGLAAWEEQRQVGGEIDLRALAQACQALRLEPEQAPGLGRDAGGGCAAAGI